jgi:hypothetical protein
MAAEPAQVHADGLPGGDVPFDELLIDNYETCGNSGAGALRTLAYFGIGSIGERVFAGPAGAADERAVLVPQDEAARIFDGQ